MLFNKFVSRASNIFAENKLLKLTIIVLGGLVIFSNIKIASLALNQKTVLVPIGLTSKSEIGSETVDETYLTAMGTYISTLLFSTSPATVESQYAVLSKLFTPEAYAKYSDSIFQTAATQAKNMVSLTFKIEKITITFTPKQEIEIKANVDKYVFGTKSEEGSKLHKLIIGYKLVNGQFYITHLEEGI